MQKYLSVKLVGGLGNQLFTYFAARALAENNAQGVQIDLSHIGLGGTDHGKQILHFNLEGEFVNFDKRHKQPQLFFGRVDNKLRRELSLYDEIRFRTQSKYQSSVLGYDPKLLEMRGVRALSGYFQTWKYIASLKHFSETEFHLKQQSNWFEEISSIAEIKKPVVIHIRRGDYVSLASDFGILGCGYYNKCLRLLPLSLRDNPKWVFSDDIQAAKSLLADVDVEISEWISTPKESNSAETLKLMSRGSAHIIANSTFSWWGAYLSRTTQKVYAPSKWFKNRIDPEFLLPPNWEQVHPDWV